MEDWLEERLRERLEERLEETLGEGLEELLDERLKRRINAFLTELEDERLVSLELLELLERELDAKSEPGPESKSEMLCRSSLLGLNTPNGSILV